MKNYKLWRAVATLEYAKVNPFAPLSTSRRGKKLLRDSVLPGILTL